MTRRALPLRCRTAALALLLAGCRGQASSPSDGDASRRGPTRTAVPASSHPDARVAAPSRAPASSPAAPALLSARPLRLAELDKLPPRAGWSEVERRFGRGMPTEGPVLVYPVRGRTPGEAWFWFFPRDRSRKDLWAHENVYCGFVSLGGDADGKVLWPRGLAGKATRDAMAAIERAEAAPPTSRAAGQPASGR